jgi:hypothetical protein
MSNPTGARQQNMTAITTNQTTTKTMAFMNVPRMVFSGEFALYAHLKMIVLRCGF